MNTLLFANLSVGASSTLVFCLGVCAAAFANYCVDVFGWTRRYRSPWRHFPRAFQSESPARSWTTRIPILGWLFLSKHAFRYGGKSSSIPGWETKTFWIRPFLTEILFAAFLTWRFRCLADDGWRDSLWIWRSWFVEFVLFWILLCASYVDFDDYVIPDAATIPGAVLGLAFSFFAYRNLILCPTNFPLDFSGESFTPSVGEWFYARSAGKGTPPTPLGIGYRVFGLCATIWTLWSFALLDRRFYPRFGLKKATAIFLRRLRRSPLTPVVCALWLVGFVALYFATTKFCLFDPKEFDFPTRLDCLVYSFLGLLVGVALIWAVRIIGGASLGVEAMGFGDVIFLGVIGTFIGWQGAVVVFFTAPFFGLVFGVLRRFFERAPQIPYGPFLALATCVYVVFRSRFNETMAPWFDDPVFILILGGVGFFLLGFLLLALRCVKALLRKC